MTARPRGGYAKGHARREEILRVAHAAFAEQGYRGASLAEIARRAEITDAGLLHHFPSKQELLMAVLEQRDAEGLDDVARTVAGHHTLAEALAAICRANARVPHIIRLFTVMSAESIEPDHPAHEMFVARYRLFRAQAEERLRAAQERGELDPALDPAPLAVQLLALWDGLQLQWLLDPDAVDMVAVFEDYLRQLEGGRER